MHKSVLIPLIITSVLLDVDCSRCPTEAEEYNGYCYYFKSDRATVESAKGKCKDISAKSTLLFIKDENEQKFLVETLVEKNIEHSWTDISIKVGDWHWILDNKVISAQGCFKDENYNRDLKEKKNVVGLNNPNNCIKACKGYKYAAVQNRKECFCGDDYGKYGYGGGCTYSCEQGEEKCGGANRNYVYNTNGEYSNWLSGHPYLTEKKNDNTPPFSHMCVSLLASQYKWIETKCTDKIPYICEIGKTLMVRNETVTWFEASNRCSSAGGQLVHIKSHTEQKLTEDKIGSHNQKSPNAFWIGATNIVSSRGNDVSVSFSDWFDGRPEPLIKGNRKCVALIKSKNKVKWMDVPCETTINYICKEVDELPPTTTSTTISTTTATTTATTTSTTTTSTSSMTEIINASLPSTTMAEIINTSLSSTTMAENNTFPTTTATNVNSIKGLSSNEIMFTCIGVVVFIVLVVVLLSIIISKRRRMRRERLIEEEETRQDLECSVNYNNPLYKPANGTHKSETDAISFNVKIGNGPQSDGFCNVMYNYPESKQ